MSMGVHRNIDDKEKSYFRRKKYSLSKKIFVKKNLNGVNGRDHAWEILNEPEFFSSFLSTIKD